MTGNWHIVREAAAAFGDHVLHDTLLACLFGIGVGLSGERNLSGGLVATSTIGRDHHGPLPNGEAYVGKGSGHEVYSFLHNSGVTGIRIQEEACTSKLTSPNAILQEDKQHVVQGVGLSYTFVSI